MLTCPNCKSQLEDWLFLEDAEPEDYTNRYTVSRGVVTEHSAGVLYADCPSCKVELMAEIEWTSEGQYGNEGEFEQLQDSVLRKFDISIDQELQPVDLRY